MNSISSVINQNQDTRQLLTVNSNREVKNSTTVKQLTVIQTKFLLDSIGDLINPKFTAWYAKCLNTLGIETFKACMQLARANSDTPKKLFGWLLKQEMKSIREVQYGHSTPN